MATTTNPKHAATLVSALESYIQELERKLADLQVKIDQSKDALRVMQRQANAPEGKAAKAGERRPRGENFEKVKAHLLARGPASIREIETALEVIPASSIQNVMKSAKGLETFEQVDGSKWRVKAGGAGGNA